ncbi:MAG: pyridoxamine 5'-phosphate oxidase family protein [Bacillota bacterium]|jgi:nitroimidazol reductase NimA-like FMN-containing flavoprotein (pyridoxamine 5'-phosphate oxidase superfamily)
MRLGQFEMYDGQEILEMLQTAPYCHIAIEDENSPYLVTMFFGYWEEEKRIYLHGAMEGRKVDLFNRESSKVCVQIVDSVEVVPDDNICDYFGVYRSLIIEGLLRPTCSPEEQKRALDLIVKKYADKDAPSYPEEVLSQTSTWCIEVLSVSGKKFPKEFIG